MERAEALSFHISQGTPDIRICSFALVGHSMAQGGLLKSLASGFGACGAGSQASTPHPQEGPSLRPRATRVYLTRRQGHCPLLGNRAGWGCPKPSNSLHTCLQPTWPVPGGACISESSQEVPASRNPVRFPSPWAHMSHTRAVSPQTGLSELQSQASPVPPFLLSQVCCCCSAVTGSSPILCHSFTVILGAFQGRMEINMHFTPQA